MKGAHLLLAVSLLALASSFAYASDPSPLQDFCVAINDTKDGGMFCFSLLFLNLCSKYMPKIKQLCMKENFLGKKTI